LCGFGLRRGWCSRRLLRDGGGRLRLGLLLLGLDAARDSGGNGDGDQKFLQLSAPE
jgi:hypothetical protein